MRIGQMGTSQGDVGHRWRAKEGQVVDAAPVPLIIPWVFVLLQGKVGLVLSFGIKAVNLPPGLVHWTVIPDWPLTVENWDLILLTYNLIRRKEQEIREKSHESIIIFSSLLLLLLFHLDLWPSEQLKRSGI